MRKEFNFQSERQAYRFELGLLLWPKHLFIAADYGKSIAGDMANPPSSIGDGMEAGMVSTTAMRAAIHYYIWRHVGTLSAVYTNEQKDYSRVSSTRGIEKEHRIALQMKYGF